MANTVPEQPELVGPSEAARLELGKLSKEIQADIQIQATVTKYALEIKQEISKHAKSNAQNADHYVNMINFYYRQSLERLAIPYNQECSSISDQADKTVLREEFAKEAEKLKNSALIQIANAARKGGGWLGDLGLKLLREDSMQFMKAIGNDPQTQATFKYILSPKEDQWQDVSKYLQSSLETIYTEGQPEKSIDKDLFFYLVANLTQKDRTSLLEELRDKKLPYAEKFAQEANSKGIISLGDMEVLMNRSYDQNQREKFNDTYLKQREKIVSLKGIRGRYGDRNIWDSVTPSNIGLFLGDALAFTNLSLNTGFAIASGSPLSALNNKWSQFSAAYLIGRHISKDDKPISIQMENPAARISETARLKFSDLQSNTLAFEPWKAFFEDAGKSPARIEAIRHFTNSYLATNKIKELPEKIDPNAFLTYLEKEPKYKNLIPEFQELLADDKVFAQVFYVIQHFHFDKETEVIKNSATFDTALDLIQEKY